MTIQVIVKLFLTSLCAATPTIFCFGCSLQTQNRVADVEVDQVDGHPQYYFDNFPCTTGEFVRVMSFIGSNTPLHTVRVNVSSKCKLKDISWGDLVSSVRNSGATNLVIRLDAQIRREGTQIFSGGGRIRP